MEKCLAQPCMQRCKHKYTAASVLCCFTWQGWQVQRKVCIVSHWEIPRLDMRTHQNHNSLTTQQLLQPHQRHSPLQSPDKSIVTCIDVNMNIYTNTHSPTVFSPAVLHAPRSTNDNCKGRKIQMPWMITPGPLVNKSDLNESLLACDDSKHLSRHWVFTLHEKMRALTCHVSLLLQTIIHQKYSLQPTEGSTPRVLACDCFGCSSSCTFKASSEKGPHLWLLWTQQLMHLLHVSGGWVEEHGCTANADLML